MCLCFFILLLAFVIIISSGKENKSELWMNEDTHIYMFSFRASCVLLFVCVCERNETELGSICSATPQPKHIPRPASCTTEIPAMNSIVKYRIEESSSLFSVPRSKAMAIKMPQQLSDSWYWICAYAVCWAFNVILLFVVDGEVNQI